MKFVRKLRFFIFFFKNADFSKNRKIFSAFERGSEIYICDVVCIGEYYDEVSALADLGTY